MEGTKWGGGRGGGGYRGMNSGGKNKIEKSST